MHYLNRNINETLLARIKQEQVIVLTGARQTGKTTLCEEILPSLLKLPYTYISFDDPDERLRFENSAISIFESIETPMIILDEVQKIPSLFDPLKYVIDKQKKRTTGKKLFILTGSSQLVLLRNIKETLAGRVSLLNLYPFSFSEIIQGSKASALTLLWGKKRLREPDITQHQTISAEKMRSLVKVINEHKTWGGYPPVWQKKKTSDKTNWLRDYRTTYIERDISDIGQVANINTFVIAQKLLCARSARILSISEVARDVSVAVNTVKRYINLLTMSFQCFLLPPYYENISKRFIKSPKIYFPDPGLNKVILGEMSVNSGAAYESWVFSELIKWKQLQPVEPEIYFYRTAAGMEIDFLLVGEGKILPIEVKSSANVSYADGRSLESFMKEHKKTARTGIIIYQGKELFEIRKNIWAIPDFLLFR